MRPVVLGAIGPMRPYRKGVSIRIGMIQGNIGFYRGNGKSHGNTLNPN